MVQKNNLFFVWTPFQLFVAQNIIMQEKLMHNILVCGYVGDNTHFYDTYDLLKIDSLWEQNYQIDCLPMYASVEKKSVFKDIRRLLKYDTLINDIIIKENIGALYWGDIQSVSCRFGAFRYARKGLDINFYEEGTKHYISHKINTQGGWLVNFLVSLFLDILVYMPKFGFPFAKWIFVKNMPFDRIPISKRYSIIPKFHTEVDKQLIINGELSDKLLDYIQKETSIIAGIQKKMILFLSQPIDYQYGSTGIMRDTIKENFSKNEYLNNLVVIKFHPRETELKKKIILSVFKEIGIDYCVLSNNYAIPIELFLMKISFDKIVHFFTSTFMYSGYIYPKTSFISIFPTYIKRCKAKGIDTEALEYIANQLQIL